VDELNTYNILKVAGSRLGSKHTEESLNKMRKAQSGENHPFFGKNHSSETLQKMSEAQSGKNNPMHGKSHSLESVSKISIARPLRGGRGPPGGGGGGTIFVYDSEGILVNTFCSTRIAAENYKCSHVTIANYLISGKLFQGNWILSKSLIYSSSSEGNE
jgi:group I intron endonuclease